MAEDDWIGEAPEVHGAPKSRFNTLSPEEFEQLKLEVIEIERKLGTGEPLTLVEEKKINILFRERRGVAMSVVKDKPVRAKAAAKPKLPPVAKKPSAAKAAQAALDDIFSGLFD